MIKAVIFDIGGVVVVPKYGEFYKQFVYKLGDIIMLFYGKDEKERLKNYVKAYKATHKLNESVLDIVKSIKAYRIATIALSNAPAENLAAFYGLGLGEYLNPIIVSGQLGVEKPVMKAFEKASEIIESKLGLNLHPDECIFVDNYEENVQTAVTFGWKGIIFRNATQLRKELKANGVDIG